MHQAGRDDHASSAKKIPLQFTCSGIFSSSSNRSAAGFDLYQWLVGGLFYRLALTQRSLRRGRSNLLCLNGTQALRVRDRHLQTGSPDAWPVGVPR